MATVLFHFLTELDFGSYSTSHKPAIRVLFVLQDYMEATMAGSYEAPIMASTADNRYMSAPGKSEGTRYSSYSGSSFNTHFDPDNVTLDKSPVYSGYVIMYYFLVFCYSIPWKTNELMSCKR